MSGKIEDPIVVGPANGVTRGDDRSYPDRGTASGMVHKGEPYGADIGAGATNRRSGLGRSTRSHAPFDNTPPGGGDRRAGTEHEARGGPDMRGTDSDPIAEDTPRDQNA